MHEFIDIQLASRYDNVLRRELFARFLWIAKSHHRAILILARQGSVIGSAFALWRPMVEAAYRGLFVGFLATEEQIVCITRGGKPYPRPFDEFAYALDDTFKTDKFFSKYAGEAWNALNGFTHGGLEQLISRMNEDGIVGDHFDSEEILDLIKSSTSLLTDTSIRFLEGMGRYEAAQAMTVKHAELYPVLS